MTSTTCSPKTIVAGLVECESGLRIRPSSPHIAAAMLTRTTPGMLLRRCMSFERTGLVTEKVGCRLALPDDAGRAVAHQHDRRPRDAVVRRSHRERVRARRGHGEEIPPLRVR